MKNGIAMISNFSMPVNSFSATDSSGTCVIVNRNDSTVRPSAIEIGMPVSMSTHSSTKNDDARSWLAPRLDVTRMQFGGHHRPLDLGFLVEASTWP